MNDFNQRAKCKLCDDYTFETKNYTLFEASMLIHLTREHNVQQKDVNNFHEYFKIHFRDKVTG